MPDGERPQSYYWPKPATGNTHIHPATNRPIHRFIAILPPFSPYIRL